MADLPAPPDGRAAPRARGTGRAALELLVAPLLVGVALSVRKLLPIEPGVGLYPLPLSAVIVSAWRGGRPAGFLAAVLSALGIAFWFLVPIEALGVDEHQLAGLAIFAAVAVLATEIAAGLRRAQRALRESEARLRQIAETTPGVLWFMALDPAALLYVNPSYARIWGEPADALLRSAAGWPRAVHPEDEPRVRAAFGEWLRGQAGDGLELEYRIRRPDGAVRWIHERASLIRDADGAATRATGIAHDFTDRVDAEEALQRAQADLARLNRVGTMGELAASLAHEIRQPIAAALTNARTCLRWLEREPPDLAEARAAAGRAAADNGRVAEIVTRVRSLFQKAPPRRVPVDVGALVREVVLLLRGEARRHAVTVRTALTPDLPPVQADPVQVQQVLMNLALNAVEALRRVEGAREITIATAREGRGCAVAVLDTGPGLPPEQLDRIFDAFYTTKPDGTGMGLPISRSIVEAHGGRLWAEPAPGRGMTFRFTLPAGDEP
jgi:PAS domain S-box-containing protein